MYMLHDQDETHAKESNVSEFQKKGNQNQTINRTPPYKLHHTANANMLGQ